MKSDDTARLNHRLKTNEMRGGWDLAKSRVAVPRPRETIEARSRVCTQWQEADDWLSSAAMGRLPNIQHGAVHSGMVRRERRRTESRSGDRRRGSLRRGGSAGTPIRQPTRTKWMEYTLSIPCVLAEAATLCISQTRGFMRKVYNDRVFAVTQPPTIGNRRSPT